VGRRSMVTLLGRRAVTSASVRTGAPFRSSVRACSGAVARKVAQTVDAELKHEQEQYEQPKQVKAFLESTEFKLAEVDGDVNIVLERAFGDKSVRVEWQLAVPYMAGEDDKFGDEATDFCVTVENSSNSGLSFYCSTQSAEDHRYVIGNVRNWASAEEKASGSAYNGPDFEDMDEKLQENLDEYLAEVGIGNAVCDFIDAMSADKEQREYLRWLQETKKFMSL